MAADRTLDARGLQCPLPVLRARKALKELRAGAVLELLATDPSAVKDVAAFCEAAGHELVGQREEDGVLVFLIGKKG